MAARDSNVSHLRPTSRYEMLVGITPFYDEDQRRMIKVVILKWKVDFPEAIQISD